MLQAQAALQLNRLTNVRSRALLFHRLQTSHLPLSQMRAATTILRRIVADTVASQRPTVCGSIALGAPRTLATAVQTPKKRGRPRKVVEEVEVLEAPEGEKAPKPRGRPRKVAIVEEAKASAETAEDEPEATEDVTATDAAGSIGLNETSKGASEKPPKARRTRRSVKTKATTDSTSVETSELWPPKGRPKVMGPPLPTQIVMVDGIEKVVKFRPGKAVPFRTDVTGRAERDEGVADHSTPRRDGRGGTGRPPAAPGPLTIMVMKYLKENKPVSSVLRRQLKQNGWYSRAMDASAEGEEDISEGKNEAEAEGDAEDGKADYTEYSEATQRWLNNRDETPGDRAEKWRLPNKKAMAGISPLLEDLIDAKIPVPKNSSKSCIIGEDKCEEIFDTFDFSEYKGCQILDFNPGFGIFSRALNKAVKPSKHLLFEPEAAFEPLLSKVCNDRSFKLIQKDMYYWDTFDELVNQGTISPKKMSREDGLNTSILVTGFLQKDVRGDRFMAQIIDAIGKQDWVFRYGRVKLLIWVDGEVAARYIPRSFGRRNRPAVLAEAFTDIREIAQPTPSFNWSDLRFLNRMDRWREPGHIPNQQDQVTGVAYAHQLTYVRMCREPEAVIFNTADYWPQTSWAETTLLDFTPKVPETDYLRGLEPDTEPWKFFNHILTTAMMSRHNTVSEVLAKIGGGTEKMLEMDAELAKMPGLAQKHAVHMSVEELAKVARAYEFWPWRAPDHLIGSELRLRSMGMLDEEENKW
ncbi:Mitochondrial transcription factor 1 [Orbilia brochopaga]|uniref:rRNA adenine N(6)-methyltransferase n=1 Tax=Orbilia brochopaga TaxID=3140254 RepID=A0AAV9UW63_9PEZI